MKSTGLVGWFRPVLPGRWWVAAAVACAMAAAVMLPAGEAAAQAGGLSYLSQFGAPGSGPGQFESPAAVAVDTATGDVYVTDITNDVVEEFSASGSYLSEFGGPGHGNGQFNVPQGIAVDPGSGDVYVLDNSGGFGNEDARIQKFDASGNFQLSWTFSDFEANQVAVDPATGDVYADDDSNNQVVEFDPSGNQIAAFGGSSNGQLRSPTTIAVDPSDGDLYVVDTTGPCRVQKFDSSGNFLFQFGSCGSGDGQFAGGVSANKDFEIDGPAGMAVDPATGDLYAVDGANNRVEVFDSSGNYLTQFGGQGSGNGQFSNPQAQGDALNPATGQLYVVDTGNDRVEVLSTGQAAPVAPAVTANPQNASVTAGTPVSFTAAATGTPAPGVQWQVSTDGGATFTNIAGATAGTLTLTATASDNGDQYQAVFTNSAGSATTTAATLTVTVAPTITANPQNQTAVAGSSVSFTAAASGTPAPGVQWQVSTGGGTAFLDIPGATAGTLTFTAAASDHGDQYQAVFTNSAGSATTTPATLTVTVAPVVTSNPADVTALAGSPVSFTAAASGSPAPAVQWQVSTDGGATFTDIPAATAGTLTFTAAASDHGDQYQAVFTNSAGSATTTAATLTIASALAPTVTANPQNASVQVGSPVSFTAAATGTPAPAVQWQVSTGGGATFTNIAGATAGTLTFTAAAADNGDQYQAIFTNSAGYAITTAATLTVIPVSTVVASPASVPADGTPSTVTVTLLDPEGQPLAGKTVTLVPEYAGSGPSVEAVVTPAQATTNQAGQATFTVTDQTPQIVDFYATDVTDTLTLAQPAQVTFLGPSSQSTVVPSPASVPADGTPSTVTVTLLDSLGQPLPGKTVTLVPEYAGSGPSVEAVVTPAQATTNQAGQATFTVTDQTPQIVDFYATDVTDTLTLAQPAQVTFLGPSSQSTVVPSPASVPADGTPSTVTVTLLDSLGQPLPGKTVTLSPQTRGSQNAVFTPAQATTNQVGQATFTVTDQLPELVGFNATDVTDTVTLAQPAQVAFVAAGLSDVGLGNGPAALASSTSAGGTITVTAAGGGASDGVVVGQYSSNPVGGLQSSTGAAFDVMLAQPSGYSQVTVNDCALNGGNSLSWWNGTAWQPITPAPVFSSGPQPCVSFVLSATSSPSLSQLTGTVFAATVFPAPQSISFTAPATGYTGGSAALTAAGGGSGNPVTFSVDASSGAGVCSVSGDTVSYLAPGSCVIDANQAGNAGYAAAPQVSQTITVSQGLTVPAQPAGYGQVGTPVTYLLAASGGQQPYTFALAPGASLPAGLTLSASGLISGTPTAAGQVTDSFTVTDSENSAVTVTGQFTLDIQLLIGPSSLPAGHAGQPYSQQLTATGTTAPLTWAIHSGSLPPGLSLSAGGLLSGTPTAAGTYTVTVTASDTGVANGTDTTTLTIDQGPQSISFTAPATASAGQSATLTATGGGSGNPVVFAADPSSGAGVCTVSGTNGTTVTYTAAGSCVIDANQAGNASYTAAPQVTATITVDQAPAFVMDSPPLTTTVGQAYSYAFAASGTPAPAYALGATAPPWLSVNASTGQVTGTPPAGTASFTYSVTAANTAGTATAGPFTVTVAKATTSADISIAMTCASSMTAGATGTCTLTVANAGPATASKVVAAVLLPAALSQVSCTAGCARHGNVFTWALASLASGASAKFSITVKASKTGTARVLAVAASQNPDPKPLNNIAIALISIKP